MGYLKLGMIIATILAPMVMYYWIIVDDDVEELTKWWNGESYDSSEIPLEIIISLLIMTISFLLIFVCYPLIIGGAIITMIVVSLRNKRLAKIKNKRDGDK